MQAHAYRVWFEVGPIAACQIENLKGVALTMRPECPGYDPDEWVDRKGHEKMMTAYSQLPDGFLELACKETGLHVEEYDTHYILQFLVIYRNGLTAAGWASSMRKLEKFVDKYFKNYVPDTKAETEKAKS